MEKLREMEVARQEMKRQAFLVELEGRGFNFDDKSHDEFGFNDEALNMVWEMWQAAQEQVLREQAEEVAQSNAFLSAVADMTMKLSSGDYALVEKNTIQAIHQSCENALDMAAVWAKDAALCTIRDEVELLQK